MHHNNKPVRGHAHLDAWLPLVDGTLRFLAADGRAFIRVPASLEGFHYFAIRSAAFRDWFFSQSIGRFDKVPGTRTFASLCHYLECNAASQPGGRVFRRVGQFEDRLLIDLANPDGEFIEITAREVCVKGDTGVPFESSAPAISLPAPEPPAADAPDPLDHLRATLNLGAPNSPGWLRCVAWLLAALNPSGPYPILVLRGPSGSGKSIAGRVLRAMIDPSLAPLASMPRSDAQLLNFARANWVLAFDHISRLTPAISDALCRLTSGIGLACREPGRRDLVQHWIKRPILLTVTDDCELPPDLAARALVVTLPELSPEDRRPEPEILAAIESAFAQILGALCHAVSRALANPRNPTPCPTRHAGALAWAIAAFPALEAEFRAAIAEPPPPPRFVAELRALLTSNPHWDGTASALLPLARAAASPKGVSQALNKHCLALADAGIHVTFQRRHQGERIIHLDASPDSSPTPQPPLNQPLTAPSVSEPVFPDPRPLTPDPGAAQAPDPGEAPVPSLAPPPSPAEIMTSDS